MQYALSSSSNSADNISAPEEAEPVLSRVNATLTSEVVITSTEILCFAKIANTFAKKPCACSIERLERVSKIWLRRNAIARKVGRGCGSRVTQVPPCSGALLEPTYTGILLRTAGNKVAGCNTFAPNVAISAASLNAIVSMR